MHLFFCYPWEFIIFVKSVHVHTITNKAIHNENF